LGRLLLQGAVKDGQTVTVDADSNGELAFSTTAPAETRP